jgi:gamma-glutamyltranspeptidase/glutathione hydrolase
MVARDGQACLSFGVMGGQYQAMGHAHVLGRIIDYRMDLQTAIDQPRYFPRPGTLTVDVEGTVPPAAVDDLVRRGFTVARSDIPLGGAQAIWIDRAAGVLIGASDPRKDGCALGY